VADRHDPGLRQRLVVLRRIDTVVAQESMRGLPDPGECLVDVELCQIDLGEAHVVAMAEWRLQLADLKSPTELSV